MITQKQRSHFILHKNGLKYFSVKGLDLVHLEMLRLLKIIDDICRENNIEYWLDGGSLIGAIRHNGFIPWDDDLDISLLKDDYIKLLKLLDDYADKNGDAYLFFSYPQQVHCCNYFASKNIHTRMLGSFIIYPVKVDIRPLNFYEKTEEAIKENLKYRDIANRLLFNKTRGYSDNNDMDIISLKGKSTFFHYYNNVYGISSKNKNEELLSHPYFEFSNEFPLNINNLFPLLYVDFENMKLPVPKDYDWLLTKLYGNYLDYPKLENRAPVSCEVLTKRLSDCLIKKNRLYFMDNETGKSICKLKRYFFFLRTLGIYRFFKIVVYEL